jgi:hypothetical protein
MFGGDAMNKNTLDYRAGHICVKYETTRYDRPEKMILWWPCFKDNADNWKDEIGLPLTSCGESYELYVPSSGRKLHFLLQNGGSTKAIDSEFTEIEPPNVRKGTDVRWHNGQWEKYLKTKGWVAA